MFYGFEDDDEDDERRGRRFLFSRFFLL